MPSQRFPHHPWSYEACATPSVGSSLCPAAVAPAPPFVPAPVPADHLYDPHYPAPALVGLGDVRETVEQAEAGETRPNVALTKENKETVNFGSDTE